MLPQAVRVLLALPQAARVLRRAARSHSLNLLTETRVNGSEEGYQAKFMDFAVGTLLSK